MLNNEVRTAVRTLELLEYLARGSDPVALKNVAADLRLPKSSTLALLRTLVARGYAERDANDRYVLAPAFRDGPGWISGPEARLVTLARPVVEEIRDRLRETIFLGAASASGDLKILIKCVSPETIRYDSDGRGLSPAYATAMGRTLLAFGDPERAEAYLARTPLLPLTPRTVTDPVRLRAILRRARADGFCVVADEMAMGGTGTAAPVFAADGSCVAALNAAAVSARFPTARERIVAAVKRGAALISQRLGHRPSIRAA